MRNVSGEDRRMLYLLAASSGFRCSELASLTPESFELSGSVPSVVVDAAYSKRRRRDSQPLPRDVALLLAEWLRNKPAKQPLWPGGWVNHAAKMVSADLGVARSAWIRAATTSQQRNERQGRTVLAYRDEQGRVFDFHSLRHQYISNLVAAGVLPKVAQTLARHSTISLTLDCYTHTRLVDLTASVNNLPRVPVEIPEAEAKALRATGTDNQSSSEVPTVVPRGAENGAVLPASKTLQIAPDCTDEEKNALAALATTPPRGKTTGAGLHQVAPDCIKCAGKKGRGPSRIRTGDGGFAIRCLTAWRRGREA